MDQFGSGRSTDLARRKSKEPGILNGFLILVMLFVASNRSFRTEENVENERFGQGSRLF